MVGGERPLLPEILGPRDPVGAKSPIFDRYSLVAPQPQHLAKKSSINTNRKSMHYALWLRSTVGRTPVFGRLTDPVLRSAFSRRVTTMWVNRPLLVSQLGQLSLSSFRSR